MCPLLLAVGAQAADGLAEWTQISPLPTLAAVAAGASRVVAVGDAGTILSTTDGVVWGAENSGTTANLTDVTYGAGEFVAVGSQGEVLRSTDGREWFRSTIGKTNDLLAVTRDEQRVVVSGGLGVYFVSTNFIDWQPQRTRATVTLRGLVHGAGVMVGVGDTGVIVVSENGLDLEVVPTGLLNVDFRRVRHLGDRFVTVGSRGVVLESMDGRNWRRSGQDSDANLFDVTRLGGRTVAGGGSHQGVGSPPSYASVITSDDLAKWEKTDVTSGPMRGVVAFQDQVLAVGVGGMLARSLDGRTWETIRGTPTGRLSRATEVRGELWVSGTPPLSFPARDTEYLHWPVTGVFRTRLTNDWTTVALNASPVIVRAARGGAIDVGVGTDGRIWNAPEGLEWREVLVDSGVSFNDVTYGGGIFLAVGSRVRGGGTGGAVFWSADGVTWESGRVNPTRPLIAVAYGDGAFMVGGEEDLSTSLDGRNWIRSGNAGQFPKEATTALAHGNGRFVGVGNGGLRTSRGRDSWRREPSVSAAPGGVVFAAGRFVAVGSKGLVVSSVNGVDWRTNAQLNAQRLNAVTVMGDRLVAVGDEGFVAISGRLPDLAPTWVEEPTGKTVGPETEVVLKGKVTSTEPVVYRWYREGVLLPDATGSELRWPQASPRDTGVYTMVASNRLGVLESAGQHVRVMPRAPSDHWQVVRRGSTRRVVSRLAKSPNRFLATTPEGEVVTSEDGAQWRALPHPLPGRTTLVRYQDSSFVAVGEQGLIARLVADDQWELPSPVTSETLTSIARGTQGWVAVGRRGVILKSPDFASWTVVVPPGGEDLNAVVWNGARFVAVGNAGTVFGSTDGVLWKAEDAGTRTDILDIASDRGVTALSGREGLVRISTPAGPWIDPWLEGDAQGLHYSAVAVLGRRVFAAGLGRLGSVGFTITGDRITGGSGEVAGTLGHPDFTSFTVEAGTLYAAAGLGVMKYDFASGWVSAGGAASADLLGIGEVGGLLVAVGRSGALVTSEDGAFWEMPTSGVTTDLEAVAGKGETGVAVGQGGVILVSSAGNRWERAESGIRTALADVCVGAGRFVAAGDAGVVMTSEDGRTWVAQPRLTPQPVRRIRFFGERFYALSPGALFVSTNGLAWVSNRTTALNGATLDLALHGESLITLDRGRLRTSGPGGDGNWSPASEVAPPFLFHRLASLAGVIAAVGDSSQIALSLNREDWYQHPIDQPWRLNAVESLRGAFYAVGSLGTIVRSAPHARLRLGSGSPPELSLEPTDRRVFRVEFSEDPAGSAAWVPLPPGEGGATTRIWRDANAGASSRRFYRAVLDE